jgi:trigger factor
VAFEKAYSEIAAKAHIKGFRPGKAPVGIIRMKFGQAISHEVVEKLVQEAYGKAIEEHSLQPVGKGTVTSEIPELTEGDSLNLTMEVDVYPEFTLPEYKNIEIGKNSYEVTEADVDAEMARLSDRFTKFEDKTEGVLEAEDLAIVDYEVILDDVSIEKLARTKYSYDLKTGASFPDFQDGLRGKAMGDTFEIPGKIPSGFPDKELADRDVIYRGSVVKMQKRVPPVLDDEFAEKISDKKTIAELRALLLENMRENARHHESEDVQNRLIEMLVEKTEIELPQALVDMQLEGMFEDFARTLAQSRMALEDYLEKTGKTLEQMRDDFLPAAEKAARSYLVIREVAKLEEVKADDKDIDEALDSYARYYGHDREALRKQFIENGEIDSLVWRIVRRKTLEAIEKAASISIEKTLPFSEIKE